MDLDELRRLSQEGQNDIANLVLQYCNPQRIAQDLMSDLQINATAAANRGEREAGISFVIWSEYGYKIFESDWGKKKLYSKMEEKDGPLVDCPNREEVSKVLFNIIANYVTDESIHLELNEWNKEDGTDWNPGWNRGQCIQASVKW